MVIRIITGDRGSGKTTHLMTLAATAASAGLSVSGFAAPAVMCEGRRVGYDLHDLRRGHTLMLARTDGTCTGPTRVGPFGFDERALRYGREAIEAALDDRLDFIAIDEIGPLEFGGQAWAPAVEAVLRSPTPPKELIITVRPSLLDGLADRFPAPYWSCAQIVCPPWPEVSRETENSPT